MSPTKGGRPIMSTRKLEPSTWRSYFDWVSKHLPAMRARIDVVDTDLGDQIETEWLPIDGLSYDPYSRELVVTATDAHIEHHIPDPREIYVLEEVGLPSALEILDGEGRTQILRITPLRELPPPPG
jgi:hypothetical protein